MNLLGLDIGSSSIKASIVDIATKQLISSAFYPKEEMPIESDKAGYAEQHPDMWWENAIMAFKEACAAGHVDPQSIEAIGIAYQMHGLVALDEAGKPVRNSIIWCDSRAVGIGEEALQSIGEEMCLTHMLNSPGNFTASKLKWVKDNEPEQFARIKKIMLPGDYIAFCLSGEINTTKTGLSEGILYDFVNDELSDLVLEQYGLSKELIPDIVPVFAIQSKVSARAATETGLKAGVPISYRAGDQPNNALSLNVMKAGELAGVAGTSGVIYAVSEEVNYDQKSRVNSFVHVNHTPDQKRIGILLCINGTGIQYAWLKKYVAQNTMSYEELNEAAARIEIGSERLQILPFGNGAERMLENHDIGAQIAGLNFNIHQSAHVYRAANEGIAFSFKYGLKILESMDIKPSVLRVGDTSMFQSALFREIMANVLNIKIETYNTDGALGAALGAGYGAGFYTHTDEALSNLEVRSTTTPDPVKVQQYVEYYGFWEERLEGLL